MTTTSADPLTSLLAVPAAARRTLHHPETTGPTGRYRYELRTGQWWWSPEVYELHGLAPDSVQPGTERLLQGIHPEDRAGVRHALAGACATGTPFAVEHRVLRRDGSVRRAVLVGEPETGPDGRVAALTGMTVDVTDTRPATPGDRLRQLETEIEQLRTAMTSRAAIEQAKGVLMLLMGCSEQVAFDLLAHISSHTHRKVRDVAMAITCSASGGTPLPADVRGILRDACPPGAPSA